MDEETGDEVLKDIRDELRGMNKRLDVTTQLLDTGASALNKGTGAVEPTLTCRLDAIDAILRDLTEQQRAIIGHTIVIAGRYPQLVLG